MRAQIGNFDPTRNSRFTVATTVSFSSRESELVKSALGAKTLSSFKFSLDPYTRTSIAAAKKNT